MIVFITIGALHHDNAVGWKMSDVKMRISWKQSSMFWFYWVIAFVSPGELSARLPPSTYPPLHPPTLYSVFTHSNAMHTPPPTVMQCNACHPPNCTSTTYQRSTQHCAVFSSHPPLHCTLQCTVKLSILWTPAQHWNCTSTAYDALYGKKSFGLFFSIREFAKVHNTLTLWCSWELACSTSY